MGEQVQINYFTFLEKWIWIDQLNKIIWKSFD